ncbi:hypothetical protein LIER_20619 [Lithospermum erythrorhizon]|uniref:Uncharacterized protein n=1 Tax=Lithospermum erythrorhizon TaxID=34254 RepID=A0AAV3QM41_LITER
MLKESHKEGVIRLIRQYKDIFACGPEDVLGIDTSVEVHHLHVDSMYAKHGRFKNRSFWFYMYNEELYKKFMGWAASQLCVPRRTTPSHITGETPFSLMYGLEAVLPAEAGIPTYRQLSIRRIIGPRTYELEKLDGEMIPCTWHASNLSKY